MSRHFRVIVRVQGEGVTEEQILKIVAKSSNLEEGDIDCFENEISEVYRDANCIGLDFESTLYGGFGDDEAHEEISKEIKKKYPKAKVCSQWTYMENLPYESYGDEIE